MEEVSVAAAEGPPPGWMYGVRQWDWRTIGLVLGIKALILTYAVQAVATVSPVHDGWLAIWDRWDAVHYLSLAAQGYQASGDARFSLVFFPLYPWLVRPVGFLIHDYLIATFIVSGFASVAAGLLLRRLAQCDEPEAVARNSVWFLLIFPTSYFLHCGYTESLFLALTLGCLLAARFEYWFTAAILGAAASLTRVNGLLLVPVLTAEVWLSYRQTRRWMMRWLWLALVPLGFVGYLWLNYHLTGDFFAFSKIMGEHWYKKFTPPWIGIRDVWLRAVGMNVNEGLNEFLAIVLTTICMVWCWFRLRLSYSVWITLNWLLINSTNFVLSVPRYALTLFPIFILFSRAATGRRLTFLILSAWSILYLALYCGRFVNGLWAF